MLPGTNERERKKKGVIYMRWTHVWMRDGILPLNCKRLETRSTVKIRVSRVGRSPFLLASETLLLSPPRKHHPHRSQLWAKLNFLVLLDYAWHGAERPPSCKKGDAKCCCPSYGHPAAGGNLLCWWLSPWGHKHAWWMWGPGVVCLALFGTLMAYKETTVRRAQFSVVCCRAFLKGAARQENFNMLALRQGSRRTNYNV